MIILQILLHFGIGGIEIGFIVVAVLLLFGSKKLPMFMRSFGKGVNEIRKATNEIKQELEQQTDEIKDDIDKAKENLWKED